MRCALVFYLGLATIFVVVHSLPELCVFRDYFWGICALCGRHHVEYTFDFIPPVSRNITHIDLEGQPLKQLPYNAFRNLSSQNSISVIKLEHCQLRHVDAGALWNLHNLITIDLSDNELNQIDSKLFSDTRQIKYIYLDFNQIELGINQLHEQELVCEKPPTLHGRKWSDISRDEFVCRSEDATSPQDSVMPRTEPTTVTEQDDTIPVTVNNGTRDQPGDTCVPQPPSNQNWILYTISVLVLVCVAAVIIGVVFVVRRTLVKSNRKYQFQLPYIITQGSAQRTNARNMDSGLPMCVVQSSAVSESDDSASNMADVNEEKTLMHHYGLREATTN